MTDTATSVGNHWRDQAQELAAQDLSMLIGGQLVDAASAKRYDVLDPAAGTMVSTVPDATESDVAEAITAAETAYRAWAQRSPDDRATIINAMADVAEQHHDEIAALDSLDTGVPFWMMCQDVMTGIRRMRMFANWAGRLTGETLPGSTTHLSYTERIPFGVVGRIIAYNHPAMFGISKIAAPLVAGNSVILKPSEQSPLSMLWLSALWADVIPPGVLSVLSGSFSSPGEQMVLDPRVRRIAFTGSQQTGRAIQRSAAHAAVKDVSLELGGKNPLLVLDDADLDEVADGVVKGMNFAFAGQSCGSTSRVLVPSKLVEPLTDRLTSRFENLRVGDPFDSAAQVGPLISKSHQTRVGHAVDTAVAGTARPVTTGSVPDHLADGFFYPPTLLVEPDSRSPVATEEIFGPVLTLIPTEGTDDAIAIANSVQYGLTASVYGRDVQQALSVAGQLDVGYVWVNDTSTHISGVPFGGVKDSGVGREESFEELLNYTQLRATNVRTG